MAVETIVRYVYTCDGCGKTTEEVDNEPEGWLTQPKDPYDDVMGSMVKMMGKTPQRRIYVLEPGVYCPTCVHRIREVLNSGS